ncbi:hypothetical protein H2204_000482 [Knufia peltigerae]|uniref:Vacuolar protein sorting-associated protein 51 homolog n=1 Tax=Knufia peltigerae TaxID=1002370 RepID=A0AA38YG17_9EURO|nr:hypothetical protein H2204_000482 [Knufia peltigerae]
MATITSPRSESPVITIPRITSPSIPSTSGTPVSSVRPSFDVPRITSNAPGSPSQHATPVSVSNPSQRRNRAALRDYYNIKRPSGASGTTDLGLSRKTSIASNASDSTVVTSSSAFVPEPSSSSSLTGPQLDDASFDAEAYVTELLKTAGLRDILRTESSLVSEIRNLDGERKALVYDNYSKLIKAVGTIAEMQKGMHKKERDPSNRLQMSVLGVQQKDTAPNLDGVEKLGEKLDALLKMVEDLGPAQQQEPVAVKARETKRQKETVQRALDAPRRLRALIDNDQTQEAEKEFGSVKVLLEQWKDVRGVDELREKCEQIMRTSDVDGDSASTPHTAQESTTPD